MFYDIIYNVTYVLDVGFSFCSRLFFTPFQQAVDVVFGGFLSFDSIIYNLHINIDIPDFGLISRAVKDLFSLMFGWTRFLVPVDYFGLCIILGTFGNILFITIIHWIINLVKTFWPLG